MSSKYKHLREFGKFRLDTEKKVLWFEGEPINLQLKEIELLCVLTENGGEVVTKEELLNRVWADSFVEESNLSRHIYQIRKIFKQYDMSPDLIQTVPRRGYRFAGEINENGSRELVIEKRSVTRTLIEELENSAEPNVKIIAPEFAQSKANRLTAFAAAGLAILITAFSFYVYNQNYANPVSNQPIKSIAVLPLKSLNHEENRQALGLGFADALITGLGRLDGIKVISVNAVSRYADGQQEPLKIGKNLGVDAVIDGTLQRANEKLRVTLRLVRIADGKQIWSGSFDESESKIFNLQDLMARQTAQALALNLKSNESAKHPTENLEAYKLFLQGEYLFRQRQTGKAGTLFKKAVELDPKFAKAWAGLAACYAMGDAMDKAETTVNRALELDPDLAEAHAVRGFIKIFLDWDWAEAEQSLNLAVGLDPNSVEAHHWRGIYLAIRGRFDEAKTELQWALELDPTSANMISDLGQIYYFSREYEKAEEFYSKASLIDENAGKRRILDLYKRQGRGKEAFLAHLSVECENYQNDRKSECLADYKKTFEKDGAKGAARKYLDVLFSRKNDKNTPKNQMAGIYFTMALYYLQLGENENAVESLRRSLESKTRFETLNFTFPFIGVDPTFDELRGNTRFEEILRKLYL